MMLLKITSVIVGLALAWADPPAIPGFALTWSDDIIGNANSLLNLRDRNVDSGTSYPGGALQWGTGEIQVYTLRPENVELTGDGNLQITPIHEFNNQRTSPLQLPGYRQWQDDHPRSHCDAQGHWQ
jgi:hypothetical protein